jgi:GH24 family phage-related lysozyme (muramidase)
MQVWRHTPVGSPNASLTLSATGLAELKADEGSIDGIYDDPSGYCTYGVGHLVHAKDKWGCFLLKAASDDDTWKSHVKKKWPGKKYEASYLPRATVGSKVFADLQDKAVTHGQSAVADRKFGKPFDELSTAKQQETKAIADAAVKEESRLLNHTVANVLASDVKAFEKAVGQSVTGVSLRQDEFDALVSFAFNVGMRSFKGSKLLEKINEGKFRSGDAAARKAASEAIEEQFLKWNKSGGSALAGLTKRRKSEATRFLKAARAELASLEATKTPAAAAGAGSRR